MRARWRPPPVTAALVVAVVVTRLAQFLIPGWYEMLARHPGAPWWRVLTALAAYDDGWPQLLSIVAGLVVVGFLSEARFGAARWLALFAFAGIAGQLFGLAWQPAGAGPSVAVAGLLGAGAAHLLFGTAVPGFARIGPVAVLIGALALGLAGDIHGPPILVGFALAAPMFAG